MNKQTSKPASPLCYADPVNWVEEWLPMDAIIRTETLQVRKSLTASVVAQYRTCAAAGQVLPPIKAARVTENGEPRLYLVDGWHRWEAGALAKSTGLDGVEVLAGVAAMTFKEARLQAAEANRTHGERLKRGELREVFRAYVQSGRHRTAPKKRGGPKGFLSYRQLGEVIGVPKTTLTRWMLADFNAIARAMGEEAGDLKGEGGCQPRELGPSLADELVSEAKRLHGLALGLTNIEERDRVLRAIHEAIGPAPAPADEDF